MFCFQDAAKSKPNATNNGTLENDEYEDNAEDALTALPLFCIGELVQLYPVIMAFDRKTKYHFSHPAENVIQLSDLS